MKTTGYRFLAGTSLALLVLTAGAYGADFTFFVGGAIPGKLSTTQIGQPGATFQKLKNGPIFGLRLNTNFVPLIGLEHTLAFSTDYLTIKSVTNPARSRGFVYNTNLLLNIPIKKFVPYATAGVGLIHQYGSPDSSIGTKLTFDYGGGLKLVRLLGPLGLRFDVRGYRPLKVKSSTSTSSLNIFEASVGLLLNLGVH